MSASFDTLKFAQHLEQAGLHTEQARALAEAQKESLDAALESQASKADLQDTRHTLEQKIQDFKDELNQKIQALKEEIVHIKADQRAMKWLLGFLFALCLTLLPAILWRLSDLENAVAVLASEVATLAGEVANLADAK